MAKFRKKPVVIEAFRLVHPMDWPVWLVEAMKLGKVDVRGDCSATIETLEGVMRADPGDWIIQGVNGEIYPCKPDIFAKTYEPADTPQALVDAMVDAMAGGVGMTIARVDPADYGAEPGAEIQQSMTVDEMVERGMDRESAEFICGQQWTDQEIDSLLRADARREPFEPIGEAMKRVVDKIKPEGE